MILNYYIELIIVKCNIKVVLHQEVVWDVAAYLHIFLKAKLRVTVFHVVVMVSISLSISM